MSLIARLVLAIHLLSSRNEKLVLVETFGDGSQELVL